MTCNQLILLLSIYRGTEDREMKLGTYLEDLEFLMRTKRWVNANLSQNGYHCTRKGNQFVKFLLEQDNA